MNNNGGASFQGIAFCRYIAFNLFLNLFGFGLGNGKYVNCGDVGSRSDHHLLKILIVRGALALYGFNTENICNTDYGKPCIAIAFSGFEGDFEIGRIQNALQKRLMLRPNLIFINVFIIINLRLIPENIWQHAANSADLPCELLVPFPVT